MLPLSIAASSPFSVEDFDPVSVRHGESIADDLACESCCTPTGPLDENLKAAVSANAGNRPRQTSGPH